MGMLDQEVIFSDSQSAVLSTGDTASTNIYYTGGANGQGDAGQTGENLWINVLVGKTAVSTTNTTSTIAAVLQDSVDGSSFADVVVGKAFTATLAGPTPIPIGTVLLQVQPPPGMRPYWRIAYRVGTAGMSAGVLDAYVSNTIQRNITRPSGIPAVQ